MLLSLNFDFLNIQNTFRENNAKYIKGLPSVFFPTGHVRKYLFLLPA